MPELFSKIAEPDVLPRLLEQKLAAFTEFLSATLLLKEHLLSGDMIQIDSEIGHRQGLMHHIDDLDTRIRNMRVTMLTGMAPEKGRRIDALSSALEETISKVIESNEDCAALAANRHDELGKELTGIRNGRLALRGYAGGKGDSGNNRAPRLLSVNA